MLCIVYWSGIDRVVANPNELLSIPHTKVMVSRLRGALESHEACLLRDRLCDLQAEQAALAVAACAARSSGHARNGAAEGSAGNGAQSAAAAPIVLSGDMNAEPGSAACEVWRNRPPCLQFWRVPCWYLDA